LGLSLSDADYYFSPYRTLDDLKSLADAGAGYDRAGYDRAGFNRAGYDRDGLDVNLNEVA
jgi:hypothetical protein